ncbi:MAG: SPFH domain-containing protein [Clostridia bacterium]|nr:SPFH domain-containing protein [Clostridia bacterium]
MKRFCLFVLCAAFLTGCGPYKKELAEEVESHETAFVIPLEVGTQENQEKLMSEEYLEHRKVAAKRIILGQRQRSTGRLWLEYEWIPTERVIKVDRKLVTKNWITVLDANGNYVKDKDGNLQDDGFPLASQDSVGFTVGINLTIMIEEKEAARYLFYFREKSLDETSEEVVRGFVQNALSDEIGKLKLTDCQMQKVEIMDRVKERVRGELSQYGITLVTIGLADEFQYDNKEVQNAIDMVYVNESKIRQAEQAQKEQEIQNQTRLMKEQNENQIALNKAKNDEEIAKIYKGIVDVEKQRAEVEYLRSQAAALTTAAEKWDGGTPDNLLPYGASMIYPFHTQKIPSGPLEIKEGGSTPPAGDSVMIGEDALIQAMGK